MPKRKRIDDKLEWIETLHYPSYRQNRGKYIALLGIGGNIGDTVRRFEHLFYYIQSSRDIKIIETSPILENPPFGYKEQNNFFNAVLYISTTLTPIELLKRVNIIESKFKRVRSFKDAPRTLDIDIIFHSLSKVDREYLKIPHIGWRDRESVLLPLGRLKHFQKYSKFRFKKEPIQAGIAKGELWLKRHL